LVLCIQCLYCSSSGCCRSCWLGTLNQMSLLQLIGLLFLM
jgi:hypothetical protein